MAMKAILISGLASMLAFTGAAWAQEAEGGQTNPATDEPEDVVVVRGYGRVDNAQRAFEAGDYVTAEIEFGKNAMCALRRERNLIASVETAQRDSLRAENTQNNQPSDTGASSRGATADSRPVTTPGVIVSGSVREDREESPTGYTCEDRGYQLYMKGLSQLQLGKIDEARENFERATVINSMLFDAHYRIGLIAMLEGDRNEVERRIRRIETVQRRCRDCLASQEIEDSIASLNNALSGAIPLE
jgi:tetratricopeptide (TPR) repeat protein